MKIADSEQVKLSRQHLWCNVDGHKNTISLIFFFFYKRKGYGEALNYSEVNGAHF